jgi:hypothetical protein
MVKKAKNTPDTRIPAAIDWAWVKLQLMKKERIPPRGDHRSKEDLITAVDECLVIARHLAKPKIASSKKNVLDTASDSLTLDGPLPLAGRALSRSVRGSMHAYLFLVTIGSDLEETATMLMESGEQLHGYLLDRVGSFAVESLAENFEDGLRRIYKDRDMSVSMRFSPGYCDWPIEEQRKLEKALDFSLAGARLTENCMMIPKKSISGLVGVGPKGLFSKKESQCVACDNKRCDYRRV